MKECAFCPHSAKLSAEHILGKWMNSLFVGRMKGRYFDGRGRRREWDSTEIDWTAKAVCQECNNTWMSEIEDKHAKPVLTPLIEGRDRVLIRAPEARSLAIFTFKTAAVIDYVHNRSGEPFFSTRIRRAFGKNLAIPPNTQMWVGGFHGHRGRVALETVYHSGKLSPTYPVSLHSFTCAIGCLVLQLLHVKHFGNVSFACAPGFENSMMTFWPKLPATGLLWPFPVNLTKDSEYEALRDRWRRIAPLSGL